jgi:hypothetical protein
MEVAAAILPCLDVTTGQLSSVTVRDRVTEDFVDVS